MKSEMSFIVFRILFLLVSLFPRKGEMQTPVITSEPQSPLLVLEGESVTLNWTYNLNGNQLITQLTADNTQTEIARKVPENPSVIIGDQYIGRVIANLTDSFSLVTFLAVNGSIDSKTYAFEVVNSQGRRDTSQVVMEVQVPPRIVSFSPPQVVMEGNPLATITLNCIATGKPTPNVTWTKVFTNGSDSDILFTGNPFEISKNRSNTGKYRCKADNGLGSAINKTISVTVEFKAEIVQMTVNDSIICLGDAFSLSCSGDGNPAIHTYQLFDNNNPVTTSHSPIVWAKTASNEGETVYRCEVNNTLGTANATRTVTVNVGSVIQSVTNNITEIEGENRTLTCHVTGSPVPSVTWTKASNGNRTQGSTRKLINISRNDAGEYKCDASNLCRNDTKRTFVIVYFKPENMRLTVNDSSVCLGEAFSLTCSADGNPAVHILQLFENDIIVSNSSSSPLVWRKSASTAVIFNYRCVANNSVGTAYTTRTVHVNVRSSIPSLRNITVIEGEDRNLTCGATGTPMPGVSWTKVSTGNLTAGNLLQLVNVRRNDAGEYKCDASNVCGNDTKSIFLTVHFKPEDVQFTTNVTSNRACQYGVVFFNCSANANPPVALYQLFENDRLFGISSSGEFSKTIMNSGNLTYKCVTNNTVGAASSNNVSITVNVPASIQSIEDKFITEQGNTSLVCNASGIPHPTVFWVNVQSGERTNSSELEFRNINRSESGEYRCEASNECGTAVKTVIITVQYPPEKVHLMTNATGNKACLNDVVNFTCSADAVPSAMSFQLFENNVPMERRSSGMWLKKLSTGGVFVYRCVANNSLGSANSTDVSITVIVPSSIQPLRYKTITEGGNLNLSCNASGSSPLAVTWVRISSGERFNGSVLQLTNISRSEARDYKCEASNECGNASEIQNINVQYPPENVKLMTNATANKACLNDVVNFTCSADAVPSAMSFQLFENSMPMERSSSDVWLKKLSEEGLFVYRCVANNSLGSTNSTDVPITVNVPASIQPLQNKTITEGGNLSLSCNASGSLPLTVSWVRISSGERLGGRVLQLTNISRSEARDYKCEASNYCANVSQAQRIDVQYPPEKVWLMTNATANKACLSDVLNFTCSADAVPSAMSFQLFENNVTMERRSSGMWFKKLSEGGVFVYRCVANNSLGSTNSTDVSITVNVPASIQPLQNETITEGGNLNLSCNPSGSSPLAVSWVRISSGERFNGSMLQLTNISRSEARDYRCEASNDCANVSQAQSIDVQYKPEGVQLMTNATANKACVNDFLKLTCSYVDANPRMTSFELFRNSTGLGKSDSRMWVKTLSNSGVFAYKCEANNSVGTAESSRVPITVNEAPTIAPIPDATVIVTNSLTLTCTASGVPAPAVSWVKVSSGQRTNGSVLQFTNIRRNEAGEYRCEASNECGNASQTVSVTVEFPLSIAPLENKTVTKGQSVILFCNVSGQPTPLVWWTHVRSGSKFYNATWNVTITDERNLGIYRCEASNMYGNTSDTISVLFAGGFCEKGCSKERSCRAIGQFHSCRCSLGKKGTECQGTEELVKFVNAQFKFTLQFEDVYTNLADPKTVKLTEEIREACFYEYKKQDNPLESARVAKLSDGSVIADVELKFLSKVSESEIKELTIKMTNDGKLGNLSVTLVVVGPTSKPPVTKEDCGAFFEGEDCKKAKPALLALTVVGALIVVGIIVAIIACKYHKKKRGEQAISNGVYKQPGNDPEGRGGTGDRSHANGGNYYGSENRGYEQEGENGTQMVTFSSNPAQTPGISVNDSSITK